MLCVIIFFYSPGVLGSHDIIIVTFALAHMFLASNFQVSLLIDQSFKLLVGTCTFQHTPSTEADGEAAFHMVGQSRSSSEGFDIICLFALSISRETTDT
jgi:hypothetical protein